VAKSVVSAPNQLLKP